MLKGGQIVTLDGNKLHASTWSRDTLLRIRLVSMVYAKALDNNDYSRYSNWRVVRLTQ